MNLFGIFGNIKVIILDKKRRAADMLYEKEESAAHAALHADGLSLFGQSLRVTQERNCKANFKLIGQSDVVEVMFGDRRHFRYQKQLGIRFNRPSTLLHLTNLAEEIDACMLYGLLESIYQPLKVCRLKQKSRSCSNMFLIEFDEIYKSAEVLSLLHNKSINGKAVRISFSHLKFD